MPASSFRFSASLQASCNAQIEPHNDQNTIDDVVPMCHVLQMTRSSTCSLGSLHQMNQQQPALVTAFHCTHLPAAALQLAPAQPRHLPLCSMAGGREHLHHISSITGQRHSVLALHHAWGCSSTGPSSTCKHQAGVAAAMHPCSLQQMMQKTSASALMTWMHPHSMLVRSCRPSK